MPPVTAYDFAQTRQVSTLSEKRLHSGSRLQSLPLATLYLTERCNSRCVTCDYWRHGRLDMNLATVRGLLPSFARLRTRVVLISGGEPLLNPEWSAIAELLRASGLQLWLLTSGLSLVKHAGCVAELFHALTVSLDGTTAETYAAIRGLDAFDHVCAGIRLAAASDLPVNLRVTVQRANYRELPAFVRLARQLGVQQISFLAVDVANPHAFGRLDDFGPQLSLQPQDLPVFEQILCAMERDHASDFASGFIAESPSKLWHTYQYFSALCGAGPYPPVRCNAPEFSAVIGVAGRINPCFFIPGPAAALAGDDLEKALNSDAMSTLRQNIRAGTRPECTRCVCSLWREPARRGSAFLLPEKEYA